MNTSKATTTLSEIVRHKLHQGSAVIVGPPDYKTSLLIELDRIEKFSDVYAAELKCLSWCIRKYLWKNNTSQLYVFLRTLNESSELLSNIITPKEYWNLDTILDYVRHLELHASELKIEDRTVFDQIFDTVQIAGAKQVITKQWEDILSSEDGNKAFIDVFDDLFQSAIMKYESDFICSLEETDVLCRMVKETSCDENRFVPWPNKAQNRWNPPGKTYLYLSYGKDEIDYDGELTLNQYICLLECKLEGETDVCFCRFRPKIGGRILDLSYNDVKLSDIRHDRQRQIDLHTQSIIDSVLKDPELVARATDTLFVKKQIERIMKETPKEKEILERTSAKEILKLICSSIYSKVDEKDNVALEKAYRSFHCLANYLESKGVTGIIYPCTRTKAVCGKNVVLFNIHYAEPIRGSIKQYHYYG